MSLHSNFFFFELFAFNIPIYLSWEIVVFLWKKCSFILLFFHIFFINVMTLRLNILINGPLFHIIWVGKLPLNIESFQDKKKCKISLHKNLKEKILSLYSPKKYFIHTSFLLTILFFILRQVSSSFLVLLIVITFRCEWTFVQICCCNAKLSSCGS